MSSVFRHSGSTRGCPIALPKNDCLALRITFVLFSLPKTKDSYLRISSIYCDYSVGMRRLNFLSIKGRSL